MQYGNIDGNLEGTFDLLSDDFEHIREGSRTALSSADLNNDGLNDLVVGNTGGGLGVWMQQPLQVEELLLADEIKFYPNPTTNALTITVPEKVQLPMQLSAFDQQGRLLFQQTITTAQNQLNLEKLSSGCYTIRMVSDKWVVNKKVVIRR
jgi:hypothetical protein